jgi:hypothetical protein
MSYSNFAKAYIQPQYTSLKPEDKDTSSGFIQELQLFLSLHPEFSSSETNLQFLHYCFNHYVRYDPISRDLPLQEQLKQAGEMAKNFMGIIIGSEGVTS